MESPNSKRLHSDSIPVFGEAVSLVFSRWSALQTAVENEWGGRDSRFKAQQIASDVLTWFTHSKEPMYVDDLESILDEGMLSLNVEVDDGSIEEVAEKLMIIHEECLDGNFKSIEDLRAANVKQPARPQVPLVVNEDEDVDEDDGEGESLEVCGNSNSNMMVDVPESDSNLNQASTNGNETKPMAADGWTVVSSRRSRGRGN